MRHFLCIQQQIAIVVMMPDNGDDDIWAAIEKSLLSIVFFLGGHKWWILTVGALQTHHVYSPLKLRENGIHVACL